MGPVFPGPHFSIPSFFDAVVAVIEIDLAREKLRDRAKNLPDRAHNPDICAGSVADAEVDA